MANAVGFAILHEANTASVAEPFGLPAAMTPTSLYQSAAIEKSDDALTLEAVQTSEGLGQTRAKVRVEPQTHELHGIGFMLSQEGSRKPKKGCC